MNGSTDPEEKEPWLLSKPRFWGGLLGLSAYMIGLAVSGQGPFYLLLGAVAVAVLVVAIGLPRR